VFGLVQPNIVVYQWNTIGLTSCLTWIGESHPQPHPPSHSILPFRNCLCASPHSTLALSLPLHRYGCFLSVFLMSGATGAAAQMALALAAGNTEGGAVGAAAALMGVAGSMVRGGSAG
jgi:hypothetical protein